MNSPAINDKGLPPQSSVVKTKNNQTSNHNLSTDPLIGWHRCAAESVAGRRAELLRRQALGKNGGPA